ncbi:MAG: LLM class flavin-dependent oxidoreductase [Chloroflexi bacterium]|nr:LLM class flavin-dependent oxidoreductase [Chloroflexota bacterium]
MHLGVSHLTEKLESQSEPALWAEVIEQTEYAELLGFESVWVTEHHFDFDYALLPNPLTALVKLGCHAKRMRLGCAVVVLPLWHPIRVAEEAALADIFTNGRIDLGLGSGYAQYEFDVFQESLDERREKFQEGLQIVTRALTEERFAHEGKYYRFPEVTVFPRPVQRPLPIWMTAVSPGTAALAGRLGHRIIVASTLGGLSQLKTLIDEYRRAYAEAGHDPAGLGVQLNRFVYVADSAAEARRDTEWATVRFQRRQARFFGASLGMTPDEVTYERFERENLTHGSPEECVENLRTVQRELGLTHLLCRFRTAGVEHRKVMRAMERFAAEVRPHLTPEPAGTPV